MTVVETVSVFALIPLGIYGVIMLLTLWPKFARGPRYRPGQPWSMAKLVMFNEKEKLAPDRQQLAFGNDNNYEYKLYGFFSGQTVYEPASNGFYPEFVLKNYELMSTNPPPIFKSQMSGSAQAATPRLMIEKPEQ